MPTVFGYGPDAFRARMFDRIGSCDVLGTAKLDGYVIDFNKPNMKTKEEGFPNLMEGEGAVFGVLFAMRDKQLEMLEGYFGGYGRQKVTVAPRKEDAPTEAIAFVARRTGRNLAPSKQNLDLCVQGAEENGFPRDFIEALNGLKPYDE